MAFYGGNGRGDGGECHWTSYKGTYDYCSDVDAYTNQASLGAYSFYRYTEPKLLDYYHDSAASYPGYHQSFHNQNIPGGIYYTQPNHSSDIHAFITKSEVNYSIYNYSEPKLIEYNSAEYAPSETQYVISYSTLEFNEPEFEEYDPTPYGGGYDLTETYGKPLPPTDDICYPRSALQSSDQSVDGSSYAAIPSPYGKDGEEPVKPRTGDKPTDSKDGEGQANADHKGNEAADESGDDGNHMELEIIPAADNPSDNYCDYGLANAILGGYDYQHNNQVPEYGYGAGLQTVDICESLFGYWPCLAKMDQKRNAGPEVRNEEKNVDPWEAAADYLFGYSEGQDGGYGDYGHQLPYYQQ